MNRITILAAVATCMVAGSGCVSTHPTRSGFLSDYSHLKPMARDKSVRVRTPDRAALAQVDSFYIEPVKWLADDLGQPASDRETAEKIRHSLEHSLREELQQIRPVVKTPGPHTAHVRAAVTAVQESRPLTNAVLFCFAGPLFNGAASAEVEVVTPEGEQIMAESVAYRGKEWEILGFFTPESHPQKAMQLAAEQLASDLERANHYAPVRKPAEVATKKKNQTSIKAAQVSHPVAKR